MKANTRGKSIYSVGPTFLNISLSAFLSGFLASVLVPPALAETATSCDGDADCLLEQGIQQYQTGQLVEAARSFQQAVEHYRQDEDRKGEADALNNLGETYRNLSQYPQAIATLEQALTSMQGLENVCPRHMERSSLEIHCNPRQGEAAVLHNLSLVYEVLGQRQQAIEFANRAKEIETKTGALQAGILTSLGGREYFHSPLYLSFRSYGDQDCNTPNRALLRIAGRDLELESLLEAFNLQLLEVGNRQDAGVLFNGRGRIYEYKGYCQKAVEEYQQALGIFVKMGDRSGEGYVLSNIGRILEKQDQLELAITFYKQAVNVQEAIRRDMQEFPLDLQQSYLNTVADTYRRLANLLLDQGRILEAQQVLELLKVEELRQFTRSSVSSAGEINFTPSEQGIIAKYNSLIEFGGKIYDCELFEETCSKAELEQLYTQRRQLETEYNDAVRQLETEIKDREGKDPAFLDPNLLSLAAKDILQNAKTPTILIYPFVTEQKLWIFWATIGGDRSILTNTIAVEVDQATLSKDIYAFRKLMEDCEIRTCTSNDIPAVQDVAQRLYHHLLPPQLIQEIERNQIQNLVFSLDRVTRYIPMSALFDGQKYLIQRYTVSTILSAELTRYDNPLTPGTTNTSVLGLGLTEPVPANPSENMPEFRALHYVDDELNAIVKTDNGGIYPGEEYLDQAFDSTTLQNFSPRHQILHIATHGEFVPALGLEQSYLVLGTKQPLRIPQLENLRSAFAGLSLVVLSACQTALGAEGENGIEIAGVAHSFIEAGVNSVIASLWQVEDRSTSLLMQKFYSQLAQSSPDQPVPISQALREAQRSMIDGQSNDGNSIARAPDATVTIEDEATHSTSAPDYSHPYYWAPFILIGNGL